MKKEAKEEGWLNPQKDSKKMKVNLKKYGQISKKKRWRRLKKVTRFNSIYNQNSMTSLD